MSRPLQVPMPAPKFDAATARRFLAHILDTETGCAELCILKGNYDRGGYIIHSDRYNFLIGGWFDDINDMIADLGKVRGVNVYVVINPIVPDLLARGRNRLAKQEHRTKDEYVVCFRWWLLDIDAKRPEGISATDEERAAAIEVRDRLLAEHPAIAASSIWGTSGNGGFILVLLPDYTVEEGNKFVVQATAWLAQQYDNERAKVDTQVTNAARLMAIPGTVKCKGEHDVNRPHRLATLDSDKDPVDVVPLDLAGWMAEVGADKLDVAQQRRGRRKGRDDANGHANGDGANHALATYPPRKQDDRIYRAAAYLDTVKPAISGQGGHPQTFDAACSLIHGFDLSIDEARPILGAYNLRCVPPWSQQELEHKLQEADSIEDSKGRPRGYKLREGREHANGHTNGEAHNKAAQRVGVHGLPIPDPEPEFKNWDWDDDRGEEDAKPKKEPLRIQTIAATLGTLKPEWPKRVGEQLFIQTSDYRPVFLGSAHRLFAWIDRFAHVDWTKGANYITQERFYEHTRMTAIQYDAIETLPHWPPIPNIYYMHQAIPEAEGKLERLLDYFAPATPIDRQLIKALILTLFWGGSPGQRPGFLITGNDDDQEQGRGIGKSTLCDILSEELGGGYVDVQPSDEMKAVKTRLLSNEEGRKRIARLDNVKTHRFSWADLEGLITSSVISGHSMYQGEGRRPNTLIWLITLNGASFSKDMSQRVIPIKLTRPQRQSGWEDDVRAFCRFHRLGLLGDIRDLLMSAPGPIKPRLRWAAWERDVLAKLDDYPAIEAEIKTRQDSIDDDQSAKDVIIEHFRDKLNELGHDPDRGKILLPSAIIAEWISEATRERYATNRASAFLKELNIPFLSKSDRDGKRMWLWTGRHSGPDDDAVPGDRWQSYRLSGSRFGNVNHRSGSDGSDARNGHF